MSKRFFKTSKRFGTHDSRLVYRGEWGEYFKYIADCLYTYAFRRDKSKDSDEVVSRLREEGIAQANRYADTEVVRRNIRFTTLHKIVVVYRGMEMVVCEEID